MKRGSRLDEYKPLIVRWLDTHPLSGQQIFQRLRELGYSGGLTVLKDYLRAIRPPRQKAFLKLAFARAECAQVDWGEYGSIAVGSTRRKLSFFVMVLCYSRQMYVEFTVSQTMEHFLSCHQNAFAVLGVPEKVMVDNLKSAVLRRLVGEAPVLNPRYVDFARRQGFRIAPCNVRSGWEKGRVEIRRWLRQEKLPERPGTHRLCTREPGRATLARRDRQRAHPRGDHAGRWICSRRSVRIEARGTLTPMIWPGS